MDISGYGYDRTRRSTYVGDASLHARARAGEVSVYGACSRHVAISIDSRSRRRLTRSPISVDLFFRGSDITRTGNRSLLSYAHMHVLM